MWQKYSKNLLIVFKHVSLQFSVHLILDAEQKIGFVSYSQITQDA